MVTNLTDLLPAFGSILQNIFFYPKNIAQLLPDIVFLFKPHQYLVFLLYIQYVKEVLSISYSDFRFKNCKTSWALNRYSIIFMFMV